MGTYRPKIKHGGWVTACENRVLLHMPNFIRTLFDGMAQAGTRVLLRWPAAGMVTDWRADVLLSLAQGFCLQIGPMKSVQGQVYMPLQALTAPRLMALLSVMGMGGSVVVPPPGKWLPLLWQWRKQPHFGGVLLVDTSPWVLRLMLKMLGVAVYQLKAEMLPGKPLLPDLTPASTALISYSSGSTGAPKMLQRTHALLEAQHQCLKNCFPPFEGQIDSSLFPNVLLHQLATATCSRLPFEPGTPLAQWPLEAVAQSWQRGETNTFTGNPYFFREMLAQQRGPFPAMQACGIGGAPVDEDLLAAVQQLFPNAQLYVIYGATEAEPMALRHYSSPANKRLGYGVGKPVELLEGMEIRQPQMIRAGEQWVQAGEIFVRGKHVLASADGWHGTGDFGYFLEGQLYLSARRGNTEVCAGYQHYMVEHVLRSETGIVQLAVLSRSTGIAVFYSGEASEKQVEGLVKQHFPEIQAMRIKRQKAIPLDQRHRSKVLYHKLQYGN
ncbi:MAG: hypothetical protein C0424_01500 [Sphingobacteriaceae bacterium]|nr:hypothetical protein [Sphingobacteriaceae bacterium]